MPYKGISELPKAIKDNLPTEAQEVFLSAVNSALKAGDSEEIAFKKAWSAVKGGWEKNKDDKWVKKAQLNKEGKKMAFDNLEICPEGVKSLMPEAQEKWIKIAKACIEAGDGEGFAIDRAWQAVKEGWEQDKEGKWTKKTQAATFDLKDAAHEVKGVEIFATGKWNGDEYTLDDLDEIINNFNKGVIKTVPLKVGHDKNQKIAGQPAVGIIQRVYKVGKKLLADIANIPKVVADLINKKAYHSVSSEIAWDADFNGSIFKRILTGVAILGAEIPAVNVLEEIPIIYKAGFNKVAVFSVKEGEIEMAGENKEAEELAAEETKKKEEELALEVKKKEDDEKAKQEADKVLEMKTKLEALEEENKKLKEKEVQLKLDEEKAKIETFIAKLIEEKKIIPSLKERITNALMQANNETKKEYTYGEEKVIETERENLLKIYENLSRLKIFDEMGRSESGAGVNSEDKLVSLAKQYALEKGVTFKDALDEVAKQHPELMTKARNINEQ